MRPWALDLGTTNTLLARWDPKADRPFLLEMPAISRGRGRDDALDAHRAVPSAVHALDKPGFLALRLGRGKLAEIGRPALALNTLRQRRNFAPTFKRALGLAPLAPLLRTEERAFTAREVARLFLRELFAEARRVSGERVRDLVVTSPVEAFETYRAELAALGRALGVRRMRFLDEPVAAALGYGLGLTRPRRALVVDIGGGTRHLVLVTLDAKGVESGACRVLAKAGRDVGGDLVDRWLLEELCARLEYRLGDDLDEEGRMWERLLLAEARRVKEAVYFDGRATFELLAPEDLRRFEARLSGRETRTVELGREDLAQVLGARGLYRTLEDCLRQVLDEAKERGASEEEIDDVLMVGGSTLLPQVYALFEARFGRARVRAWHPFEAVAYGGAVFAAGRAEPKDFIVHDYALVTYDLKSKDPLHTVIVPRGTRFPSRMDLWKRTLVPTCSLGEPERLFKLVICEIGQGGAERTFAWDEAGGLHKLAGRAGGGEGALVVKLNEANPALGRLEPPHSPRDQRPRLEVAFGVNADRWLCATVFDLYAQKHLMREEPVVRLL
jgi:molecular chaperone DnaK (HSP70)